MTKERRCQIRKCQEEGNVQVVKVTKKKNGAGFHVSGPYRVKPSWSKEYQS